MSTIKKLVSSKHFASGPGVEHFAYLHTVPYSEVQARDFSATVQACAFQSDGIILIASQRERQAAWVQEIINQSHEQQKMLVVSNGSCARKICAWLDLFERPATVAVVSNTKVAPKYADDTYHLLHTLLEN